MRRQLATALVALGALASSGAAGYGGEATVLPNGDFLIADIDLSSPIPSARAKPRPATLTFHHMFGNYREGSQPRGVDTISVRLPRGMTTHPGLVGECPLPTSNADVRADRCPASSRVGTGTALADARSLGVADPIPATVTAYNGAEHEGNPTLVLQGVATIGGSQVVTEFDFDTLRARGRFGIELRTFDPFPSPPGPGGAAIALNKLDLRAGRTVITRVRGRRVKRGFIETPTSCTRSGWAFEEEFVRADGSSLKASDVMSCAR
jgi:hypothetical protein